MAEEPLAVVAEKIETQLKLSPARIVTANPRTPMCSPRQRQERSQGRFGLERRNPPLPPERSAEARLSIFFCYYYLHACCTYWTSYSSACGCGRGCAALRSSVHTFVASPAVTSPRPHPHSVVRLPSRLPFPQKNQTASHCLWSGIATIRCNK